MSEREDEVLPGASLTEKQKVIVKALITKGYNVIVGKSEFRIENKQLILDCLPGGSTIKYIEGSTVVILSYDYCHYRKQGDEVQITEEACWPKFVELSKPFDLDLQV